LKFDSEMEFIPISPVFAIDCGCDVPILQPLFEYHVAIVPTTNEQQHYKQVLNSLCLHRSHVFTFDLALHFFAARPS
jgi:hypothetical protein